MLERVQPHFAWFNTFSVHWFKHILLIPKQVRKELIQMDINMMMTNGTFTMNGKHTPPENELNRLQNHTIRDQTFLESLINLSVSVTILLFTAKSKFSFPYNRVLRVKGAMCIMKPITLSF